MRRLTLANALLPSRFQKGAPGTRKGEPALYGRLRVLALRLEVRHATTGILERLPQAVACHMPGSLVPPCQQQGVNRHSPDDRRLKPTLRRLGVPGNLGPPPTSSRQVLEHADKERRTENASSVVNIRTSPVVFDRKRDNRTLYAVDVTGGDRSSATSRRMSANRGMATSAIWKAT